MPISAGTGAGAALAEAFSPIVAAASVAARYLARIMFGCPYFGVLGLLDLWFSDASLIDTGRRLLLLMR